MAPANAPRLRALTGVHEPSAMQQLPDGRFRVAEDEREQPFWLVTLRQKSVSGIRRGSGQERDLR